MKFYTCISKFYANMENEVAVTVLMEIMLIFLASLLNFRALLFSEITGEWNSLTVLSLFRSRLSVQAEHQNHFRELSEGAIMVW